MIQFNTEQPVAVNLAATQETISQIRADAMGGWFELPERYERGEMQTELASIKSAAAKIQSDSKFLVCIGIGGSYLGHRALIEALGSLPETEAKTKILYAGNSLSPLAFDKLLKTLGDADFSINVISKSGTTTEPAVAFRFLKEKLIQKYGSDGARARIYATTDANRGALHDEALQEKYTRFVVPDNIGGRYSVLSAVGLLPLAVAGIDIDNLLAGAAAEYHDTFDHQLANAAAIKYAATRAELAASHHDVEILATFEPQFQYFEEWWKQLFGESEGKQNQGIFPASVVYTTDLHSLGQYLQEGRRNIFETMLELEQAPATDFAVPSDIQNLDGLNYLADKNLSFINQNALDATIAAHRSGGIPVLEIKAPDLSARSLGALVYFFELSCAISAKLQGVNPFDQPGVEAYKTNMFMRLGKPGF